MAHIEESRAERWRNVLWLLMVGAGTLLLICAALAV
jgi:hypothetical protein